MPESHCGVGLTIRESLQGQGLEEKRGSRLDSLSVSQLGFRGLRPLWIYCLYAIYTEIYIRYFCLTPFVCEFNNWWQLSGIV